MTDRRYGVNKYGDGKLYGPSDAREALAWDVSVDWDDNGIFDANETDLLTGIGVYRGRTRLLSPSGEGFESIPTGKAVITLNNADGRFDGWNTSSPLYPNVKYGKDLRLRVRDLNTDARYGLFRGTIADIVPVGYGEDARVMIYASDGLDLLRNYVGRVAMQHDITPDEAIGMVLDAVHWPARWGRSLDVSAETIPFWWSSGSKQAMSEIEDLATSFLGYFFADRDGRARYVKRSSVIDAVANYAQGSLLKDLDNPQPYTLLRNVTRVKVHPRNQASTSTIFVLAGTPPAVLTGGANSQKFFANYTYNNGPVPAENVTISVFEANTQSNFLGTDETANCVAALTDFGDSGFVEVTNNSAGLVYIRLELEGDAIYEPNVSDVTYPSDLSGISMPRELVLDMLWQQDLNVARDIANVLGAFYGGLHPMPSVKLDSQPALQFAPDLFDIATADLNSIGLNGVSFRVGGLTHETDSQFENCQRVKTRLYLEPYVSADDFMQWDTASVWDESTIFGY